jgi:hypothetical protein
MGQLVYIWVLNLLHVKFKLTIDVVPDLIQINSEWYPI